MIKYTSLLIFLAVFSQSVLAQHKLKVFEPDIGITDNPYGSQFKQTINQDYPYFDFRIPISPEYIKKLESNAVSDSDLPSVYDLRTAGPGGTSLLTSVKAQLGCGACWAFATYGSIESRLKVLGMGDYDFSENNLKNCHGFELQPCVWGHHFMSTSYLSRRDGPVYESDDPYVPANDTCGGFFEPPFYFTDARYPPPDLNTLKECIMDFGGIYTTMRFRNECYNPVDYTYCDTVSLYTNHGVLLVGWDDNKVITGGPSSPPGGRIGAFIVKNSRGLNFGEDGFFYVAYSDTLIKEFCSYWPEFIDYDSNAEIYQYDEIGGWPYVGYDDTIAWGLTKFIADGNQHLTKVGTYVAGYEATLAFEFYDDFDGTNFTNLLSSIPVQYCEFPGYYTFDLSAPVTVSTGADFYVKVRYTTPYFNFPIAIEQEEDGYTNPVIETGNCWTSPDHILWEPIGLGTGADLDLCIKVYAENIIRLDLKVFLEGPYNGSEMNTDLNTALPLSQPYNTGPWNYSGTESVTSIPNADIVDWVLVELRDAVDAASAGSAANVAQQAAFLLNDGQIVGLDGTTDARPYVSTTISNNLFVVVWHRNHIGIMSAYPLTENAGVYSYDFTSGPDQAYGGVLGHKEISTSVWGMVGGDGDANRQVDNTDKNDVWNLEAGLSGYLSGDFNMDNQVANPDKNDIWAPNSGGGSQVPD